jgi:transcriptional regulator with XRE-family HTH domain
LYFVSFCNTLAEIDKSDAVTIKPEGQLLADVGRRIRATRVAQGLSLEQLARLTGISSPALSLIETAKRDARLTTLGRIATALRVPLAALLDDRSPDPRSPADKPSEGYDLGDYL